MLIYYVLCMCDRLSENTSYFAKFYTFTWYSMYNINTCIPHENYMNGLITLIHSETNDKA